MKAFAFTLATFLAVQAAPAKKMHALTMVKRDGVSLPFHYPESSVKSVNSASFVPVSLNESQMGDLAAQTIAKEYGVDAKQLKKVSQFTDKGGVTHVYLDRLVNGVEVRNQNAAVHIQNGQVTSFSASINVKKNLKAPVVAPVVPVISEQEAIKAAEAALGVPKDETAVYQGYLEMPSGDLAMTYMMQVRDDKASKWFHVAVDAHNGQVVEVIDYYNKATFNVIKLPNQVPTDGFVKVSNAADKVASPFGWNSDGSKSFTDTRGTNVDVYVNGGSTRGVSSGDLVFDSKWDPTADASTKENQQASTVHLFYIVNTLHDITYQYGFTEAAGNFQTNNNNLGGSGNDQVKANTLSTAGTNNANFATPPDGQSGQMNMYVFDITKPKRDGTLDSGIPIHEFTHGVSNRLTGGARNGRCLQGSESGGMGEGWSDTLAVYLGRKASDTRSLNVAMGWYVLGTTPDSKGIRRYPYSTDMKVNPETFSFYKKSSEVHNVGEIWATMLYELYWNMVDKHGFSDNWLDAKQQKGNIIALQLVIGGMMLQPCNPNFSQARDAILQTDVNYYKGDNKCEIWKAFAKRGLGVDAVQSSHTDGFKVPDECANTPTPPTPTPSGTPSPSSSPSSTPSPTTSPKPPAPQCNPNNICCRWFGFDCFSKKQK